MMVIYVQEPNLLNKFYIMENNQVENQVEDNKGESCKKHSCCGGKHHKCFGIAIAIILFIGVFGMGLAIGRHSQGERRERGNMYGRFEGGYGKAENFRGGRGGCGCDGSCGGFIGGPQPVELQGFTPGKNLEIKNGVESQTVSASSSVTK